MVYFGERRFKQTRSGPESSEMMKILIPVLVLGGLALFILAQQGIFSSPDSHSVHLPVRTAPNPEGDRATGDEPEPQAGGEQNSESPIDSLTGERVAQVVDPPSLPPHPEPETFVPLDTLLDDVRDGGIDEKGEVIHEELPSESSAISYLFHRQRAGFPVPVQEGQPSWPDDYEKRGEELRGLRYVLDLELLEEPLFRTAPPNPSGVEYYYDVIGMDSAQRFHRVLFATREQYFGVGSHVRVEADYLRLHRYRDGNGQVPAIPQWIAYEMKAAPQARFDLEWEPVVWVTVIGGFGVLIVWVSMVLQGGTRHAPRRRYSRRRSEDRTPPDSE